MLFKAALVSSLLAASLASAQPAETAAPKAKGTSSAETVPLTVPAGVPLRLYLTKRVSKRLNAPVEAKLMQPVYAFDHEVMPAGATVLGHVSRVEPVSKLTRIRAIVNGDFTPLRIAQIQFTSVVFPGGESIAIETQESPGLNSLVPLKPPKQRKQSVQKDNAGLVASAKQQVADNVNAQIDRVKSIPDVVSSPGKKEWLYDYAMSRLPYHPQYLRSRARFDAELSSPLIFGSETIQPRSLALLGSQPPAGSKAHARLLTPLDSRTSTRGEKVEAVLEQPLFSSEHKLILPEGTVVDGTISAIRPARWFHRGGKLRFNFQSVDLSSKAAQLHTEPGDAPVQVGAEPHPERQLQVRTEATLTAAEAANGPIKVDTEGGVQASESKTRFIGTAAAAFVAHRAADNDPIRSPSGQLTGQSQNVPGRTLGGGMGFGLLGAIAAQSSRNVGAAFGYYGLAWSIFSTAIARGAEVEFKKNAVIDIGFNTPAQTDAPTLNAEGATASPAK